MTRKGVSNGSESHPHIIVSYKAICSVTLSIIYLHILLIIGVIQGVGEKENDREKPTLIK
jgi:hypothetical protein